MTIVRKLYMPKILLLFCALQQLYFSQWRDLCYHNNNLVAHEGVNSMQKCIFHSLVAAAMILSSLSAQAGFIRYDMSYLPGGSPTVPAYEGYMTFSDMGPVPGNIWSNIVDWEFEVDSFVFDPTNTAAWGGGVFEVDAVGNVVRDFDLIDSGGTPTLFFPCFSSSGDCSAASSSADSTVLSFQSFVVGTIVKYPGGGSSEPNFGGTISYSGPIIIPVPASASLVLFGLGALLHRRRRF
jgi:uncharacterized protein (TIGR03382 family)